MSKSLFSSTGQTSKLVAWYGKACIDRINLIIGLSQGQASCRKKDEDGAFFAHQLGRDESWMEEVQQEQEQEEKGEEEGGGEKEKDLDHHVFHLMIMERLTLLVL